jgi:hypothetical protein
MPKETATATMTENKRKELPPKTVTTATTATAQSSDANSNSNKNDTHGSFDGKRGGKTIGLTIPFDLGKIDDNIKLKILDLYSNKLQGTYSTIRCYLFLRSTNVFMLSTFLSVRLFVCGIHIFAVKMTNERKTKAIHRYQFQLIIFCHSLIAFLCSLFVCVF